MTGQSPGELALVYLQDMLPEAAVAKFELLKHDILTVQQMRDFYKKIIAEEKSNKRKKAKGAGGLHELVERLQQAEQAAGEGEHVAEEEEPAADNMLYSLLSYAKDEDVAKVPSPQELLTFVRWKSKGGGKGNGGGKGGKGKGGFPSSRPNGPPANGSPPAAGTPFVGLCNHCNQEGHRKSECPELDKIMNARRAAGMGGASKGNGKGFNGGGYNGNRGNPQGGGANRGGGGAYAIQDMFSFIDRPPTPGTGGPPANNPTQWGGRINALFAVGPTEVPLVPTPEVEWTRPPRVQKESKTFESPNSFGALKLTEEDSECACEEPGSDGKSPEDSVESA